MKKSGVKKATNIIAKSPKPKKKGDERPVYKPEAMKPTKYC